LGYEQLTSSGMPDHPEISKEAEQDYDALLGGMLPLVEKWLQEQDGFVPCGAAITADGQLVGQMAGADEAATTESVMRMLFTRLQAQAQAGEIRATCVCYNGEFEEDGELLPAIFIILEHTRGPATIFRRPYRKNPDGTYGYARMEGQTVQPEIFAVQ
jgi:hypothetical protein